LAGLILIVFAGMFHVYRYAMAKTKEVPPPPPSGPRTIETKSIAGLDSKELPSPSNVLADGAGVNSIDKPNDDKPVPETAVKPQTSGIKADAVNLETNKDQNVGTSDLKKL